MPQTSKHSQEQPYFVCNAFNHNLSIAVFTLSFLSPPLRNSPSILIIPMTATLRNPSDHIVYTLHHTILLFYIVGYVSGGEQSRPSYVEKVYAILLFGTGLLSRA